MTNGDNCTQHRPVALTNASTGEVIGWTCGDCGFGMVNAAAFARQTYIPIEQIPSRSTPGEVLPNEEASDDDAARQALDAIAAGEPVLPWEDVKARLDLDD